MSDQQKERRQLVKRPEGERDPMAAWWSPWDAFCRCAKGCGARCPCARNGIGCWFEKSEDGVNDWGCNCHGQCTSSVAGYICDFPTLKRSRCERVRELSEQLRPAAGVGALISVPCQPCGSRSASSSREPGSTFVS